jgi:hypothetical protein
MWEDLIVEDKFIRVSVAQGLQSNRINAVMFTSRQIHIAVGSVSRTSELQSGDDGFAIYGFAVISPLETTCLNERNYQGRLDTRPAHADTVGL